MKHIQMVYISPPPVKPTTIIAGSTPYLETINMKTCIFWPELVDEAMTTAQRSWLLALADPMM